MIAHHGTTVPRLSVLRPFANPDSNLAHPCVYLSTDRALASLYVWNRPFKWMTFEIGEDGLPVYFESFPHGLETFYAGVTGCLYTCEGTFETDERTTIRHAVVCRQPVPVAAAEEVPDALERILRFAREGKLLLHRYEDLTDQRRASDRRMILNAIRRQALLQGKHPMARFVAETFPDLWAEAQREAERAASPPDPFSFSILSLVRGD